MDYVIIIVKQDSISFKVIKVLLLIQLLKLINLLLINLIVILLLINLIVVLLFKIHQQLIFQLIHQVKEEYCNNVLLAQHHVEIVLLLLYVHHVLMDIH